jgi:hypothetical protein
MAYNKWRMEWPDFKELMEETWKKIEKEEEEEEIKRIFQEMILRNEMLHDFMEPKLKNWRLIKIDITPPSTTASNSTSTIKHQPPPPPST